MVARLKYWYAKRVAISALCLSLEETPELWVFGYRSAKLNGLRVELFTSNHTFFDGRAKIYTCDVGYELPYFWGRRVRKAFRRATGLGALKDMLKELKPRNTPLQIEDASR